MSNLSYKLDEPDIIIYENIGYVEFFEFDEGIWVMNVVSIKKGKGVALSRRFIEYARGRGKNLYGNANPQKETSMTLSRLKRWYDLMGAKKIHMKGHENAMVLEV